MLFIENLVCQRGSGARGFRLEVPSLKIQEGEAVAITGPSGSGKSTLLDVLGLVLRPTEAGRFTLGSGGGTDIQSLWTRGASDGLATIRAGQIGYILQTGGLLPFLTVHENIRLSVDLLGAEDELPHLPPMLAELGIDHLLDKWPSALSVGERQRVAIARALAHRPALVIADEPTASVDPRTAVRIVGLLQELVRSLGTTLVLVSHDWDLVGRFQFRRIEAEILTGASVPTTRFGDRA